MTSYYACTRTSLVACPSFFGAARQIAMARVRPALVPAAWETDLAIAVFVVCSVAKISRRTLMEGDVSWRIGRLPNIARLLSPAPNCEQHTRSLAGHEVAICRSPRPDSRQSSTRMAALQTVGQTVWESPGLDITGGHCPLATFSFLLQSFYYSVEIINISCT